VSDPLVDDLDSPLLGTDGSPQSDQDLSILVRSEPLTYHRHAQDRSYFRDLVLSRHDRRAEDRLRRHAEEMRVIREERNRRAMRGLREGEFEYRVEPNRTDGYGGYFSPPLWMNEFFATAKRPGRVLAGLMPKFDLPDGVGSINLPILTTGTLTAPAQDPAAIVSQEFQDAAGTSNVATLTGQADVALQSLEQSPAGASLDWALLKDMAEDYDRDLETQVLIGSGAGNSQLLGVVNVAGRNAITYTSGLPTASAMWPYFGQAAAQIGDNRDLPPECFLMRTARWAWLGSSEDSQNRPLGLSSPFFIGNDDSTPDPAGGLISWPAFLSDAIPATLGAGGNQDEILCLRPTDLILLEGQPQTAIMREPLSGNLGVRIQLHTRVAALTARYPSGISVISGTGLVVQAGL
jgi:hypothetical protein